MVKDLSLVVSDPVMENVFQSVEKERDDGGGLWSMLEEASVD